MEEQFKKIMIDYINSVNYACDELLKNINNSENICLKSKKDFFDYRAKSKKMEFEFEGTQYNLHGKGCTAFNDTIFLDWDFGYRSRWCGINPWKVAMSLMKSKSGFLEYYDGNLIKKMCEESVKSGIMFIQQGQYYFSIPENQTIKPNFPKEFDTLIVEYNGKECSVLRNKIIDRFIRKSNRIYNRTDKNENCYLLKFVSDGEVIYSILYDDIGYPESAVKIMSDDILKNMNM